MWSGSEAFGTFLLLEKYTPKECLNRWCCCCCFPWTACAGALSFMLPTSINSSFWWSSPDTNRDCNNIMTISFSNRRRTCRNCWNMLLFSKKWSKQRKLQAIPVKRTRVWEKKALAREKPYWVHPANRGHISRRTLFFCFSNLQ